LYPTFPGEKKSTSGLPDRDSMFVEDLFRWRFHGPMLLDEVHHPIDQFRYIKIQTIDLNTRLWGITTKLVGFIPQNLVLRSIV